MIKSSVLKAVALCVCPVVGTSVAVKTIPAVRHIVHKATAEKSVPYEKANREPISIDCPPSISGGIIDHGFEESLQTGVYTGPSSSSGGQYHTSSSSGGSGGSSGGVVSSVPEPATWLQMIVGFSLVGLGVRASRSPVKEIESITS